MNLKAVIKSYPGNGTFVRVSLVETFENGNEIEHVHFDLHKSQVNIKTFWDESWNNQYRVELDIDVDKVEFT